MAHLPMLRELTRRLRLLRDRVPVDCLLCAARTAGGLCLHCRNAVCASMHEPRPRCLRCDLAWPAFSTTKCPDCAEWSTALLRVVAAFDYEWPGELLIHRFKGQGRFGCGPQLAAMLAERCRRALPLSTQTVVVAVPASRASVRRRGFNPAAEVGRSIAHRLQLPWRPELLQRTRESDDQKALGREARRDAVEGLYRCMPAVAGFDVLVVDDVMTTGSTVDAIAKALRETGARDVFGAVLARTPSRHGTSM